VLVSRVTVADGRGWVTAQVNVAGPWVTGFEVYVRADNGLWGSVSDVPVPALGLHCRSFGGIGLQYSCRRTSADHGPYLSPGYYEVKLPATHTGALPTALSGVAWLDVASAASPGTSRFTAYDWFPAVDGSHFRTTAEVREASLTADATSTLSGVATIPLTLIVAPGEQLASVDLILPEQHHWSLTGSNTLPQGIWCSVRLTTTGGGQLHCAGRFAAPVPAGRYELVSTLRYYGSHSMVNTLGSVAVTMVGGTAEPMDAFLLRFAPSH